MSLEEILFKIDSNPKCDLIRNNKERELPDYLPTDLLSFYQQYDGISFFSEESYGIQIVPFDELSQTNKVLFPSDDVIWEELENDISMDWYLIAKSEQLSQYISVDFSSKNKGVCYDSLLETHANPDESPIIAKSFTELLQQIYNAKGKDWYWLASNFQSYGDAYDGIEI